jgi:hypothetical protein
MDGQVIDGSMLHSMIFMLNIGLVVFESAPDRTSLTQNPFAPLYLQLSTSLYGANMNPFGTKSLEYQGGTDPNNKNYVKLSDALNSADTERRKDAEAADRRERAAEIAREERQAKIDYMRNMPDWTPAGTGK